MRASAVLERTNIRAVHPEQVAGHRGVDLVVVDVSFISLRLVLPVGHHAGPAGRGMLPADGEAAVRGGQGASRQGWGGGRRRVARAGRRRGDCLRRRGLAPTLCGPVPVAHHGRATATSEFLVHLVHEDRRHERIARLPGRHRRQDRTCTKRPHLLDDIAAWLRARQVERRLRDATPRTLAASGSRWPGRVRARNCRARSTSSSCSAATARCSAMADRIARRRPRRPAARRELRQPGLPHRDHAARVVPVARVGARRRRASFDERLMLRADVRRAPTARAQATASSSTTW